MTLASFDPFGPALSPVALVAIGALVLLYLRGARRPRLVREQVSPLRHLLFASGVLAMAFALEGALAATGSRLFAVHQVQHLLLRLIGPILVVLSHPWPILRAGLPRALRHSLGRMGDRPGFAGAARLLTRLDVNFVLMIAALYVWQVPALHNAAVTLPWLALLAHLSMTAAGLGFFSVTLDRRAAPVGAIHGLRILALIGIILSNILLGSLTTLKGTVLYSGYDIAGRLWDFAPLADETVGGYTIWVPSSFVIVAAIILVFNGWNALEVRQWNARHDWSGSNAAALEYPETAQELRLKVSDRNLRLVRTLALIAATMFVGAIVTVTTLVYAF